VNRRLIVALVALAGGAAVRAQIYTPPAPTQLYTRAPLLGGVGIDQRMGAQVPLDASFDDESGNPVTLAQYLGKPAILALVYYECPSLCNMVLNGVLRSVKDLPLTAGQDYQIVAVSFDPRETSSIAAAKKRSYVQDYGRPDAENGWHFLTGPELSSKKLAAAVGFRYAYDSLNNQYAHGSAIMILTPDGRVAKYFYGINYPSRDVRLGLIEAANHRIGSPVDQVLLYCYHYDPATGKYGVVIMNVMRLGGLLTLGALASFMIVMLRRDRRQGAHSAGRAHPVNSQDLADGCVVRDVKEGAHSVVHPRIRPQLADSRVGRDFPRGGAF
jgi:protein SCO1/2